MEFCEIICVSDSVTASYLDTGGLSFNYFKMHVWSTTGSTLVVLF